MLVPTDHEEYKAGHLPKICRTLIAIEVLFGYFPHQ